MTSSTLIVEAPPADILAVYNAEKSRREKLSTRAFEREARKREERARTAEAPTLSKPTPVAFDAVVERLPFVIETDPDDAEPSPKSDGFVLGMFMGIVAGLVVVGIGRWVFG